MKDRLHQLEAWRLARETEHLEFKEAKHGFHFEKLAKYCAALANEGGGHMVLGVTDAIPRRIVGTLAFADLERTKAGLVQRLGLRIDAAEVPHPEGRVLVFTVPSRPVGVAIALEGSFWMRSGQDLVPMTQDLLRRIFEESGPDHSAEVIADATLEDLDPDAVENLRRLWHARAGRSDLLTLPAAQLLEDAELLIDGRITIAALVLLATTRALGRRMAQAEVVFEYRSSERAGPADQRVELRRGFLTFFDELWRLIALRNTTQSFQDGLFMRQLQTFNEAAVREGILNAVSHRDYRHAGSVFVRQFATRVEIVSPGGFPRGIGPENVLWRQNPRNRRLAEVLAKCGFVERAGQGVDRMYEACIREGKVPPDFSRSDDHEVALTLDGTVQDAEFVRFLERVVAEQGITVGTTDLYVLHLIHTGRRPGSEFSTRVAELLRHGPVERAGRGRYVLSRRFYKFIGRSGEYTRKVGLDRETNRMLLLKHIRESGAGGAQMEELMQVLPSLSRHQVARLVGSLKREGLVDQQGKTRASRWIASTDGEG